MLIPTEDVKEVKNHTLELLSSVKREGMPELISWLNESGYFVKPASIKHHMNMDSGLLIHSYRLYQVFKQAIERTRLIPEESVIICAFLHDICKVPLYEMGEKGWKYTNDRDYEHRHGTLSIEMAEKFISLTDDEFYIIKYHMGFFYSDIVTDTPEYSVEDMRRAIDNQAAVQIFAACDMEVSRWNESCDYWNSDVWKAIAQRKQTSPEVKKVLAPVSTGMGPIRIGGKK